MTTNFPTSLDTLTNPTASDTLDSVTVPHAAQHANANDAIEALQAKVGVDGSGVTSSHDYKLTQTINQGLHTIWIPAVAMIARTTSGAASGSVETATNKVMVKSLDYDASTDEFAQFQIRMPKSWDEGTVTAAFTWTANSTSTNSVVWGLQAVALSDDDALDTAFGTAQTVTDANKAVAYDVNITGATSAITIAGTPAAEDLVIFQVYRDADNGSDNLAVDALLLGVTLYVTLNAATDA